MKQLLVICGPTATGKTNLAFHVAKVFGGELISADSRQVYKYMDIGTGKDIPSSFKIASSNISFNSKKISYYVNGNIRLWGLDIVNPTEKFSVSSYISYATKVVENIHKRNKIPIIVGGTGFYIKAIIDGVGTAHVPINKKLRKSLQEKSVNELFDILGTVNKEKARVMNNSDKNNPRRLIRAIEVAKSNRNEDTVEDKGYKSLFIGLKYSNREALYHAIDKRVDMRLKNGFEKEVLILKRKGMLDMAPSETLGYKQWIEYLNNKSSKVEAISNWKQVEHNYAKRQMTWFSRDSRIVWFNVDKGDFKSNIESLMKTWHNTRNQQPY